MRFRLSVKLGKSTGRYVLDENYALTFTSKSTKAFTALYFGACYFLAPAAPVCAYITTEFFHALVILLSKGRVKKTVSSRIKIYLTR